MDREAVLNTLRAAQPVLEAKGIAHAAVFGSVARGEAGPTSDIDIMIELAPDAPPMGVWEYVGVMHAVQDLFSGRVDVSNRASLKPRIRPNAERDAIYAF